MVLPKKDAFASASPLGTAFPVELKYKGVSLGSSKRGNFQGVLKVLKAKKERAVVTDVIASRDTTEYSVYGWSPHRL